MKKYVKPTIDVLELRANENIVFNVDSHPDGGVAPITKYNMESGASSY